MYSVLPKVFTPLSTQLYVFHVNVKKISNTISLRPSFNTFQSHPKKKGKGAPAKRKSGKPYTEESIDSALKAIRENKVSVRRAAMTYGIPVQTLRDRTNGIFKGMGNQTLLTAEEELVLVEHVTIMAQLGYGYTNIQLQHFAGEMMFEFGRRDTAKPLSNNWLYGFLDRWSDRLRSVNPSKLESTRARNATPETIQNYYKELEKILDKYNLKSSPERIYNVDETGLPPEHKPPNIVASTESKPQTITSPRSTTVTMIGCVNALGNSVPPHFVFKGKRNNPDLMEGASAGATSSMSESGWSNRVIFQSYLEDHFMKHVQSSEDKPVLLMYDGHASHVSPYLIQWAREHHIILFVLPPHTSHLLQPLDVGVFGPFKKFYYSECSMFMRQNIGQVITKYNMASIASKAYLKAATPVNIQASFKKTGIFPFSSDAIPQEEMYAAESFREENPIERVKQLKEGKGEVTKFIESKMEKCMQGRKKDEKNETSKEDIQNEDVNAQNKVKRPQPGGKAITEGDFHEKLVEYDQMKATKVKSSCKKRKQDSQKASGSGCIKSKVSKAQKEAQVISQSDDSDEEI